MRRSKLSLQPAHLLLFSALASAQAPVAEVFRADRGFRATGSYSVSDIESVNDTNGNVTVKVPIAQTPPGRNGANFKLGLVYNSALFDLAPIQLSTDYLQSFIPDPGNPTTYSVNALTVRDAAAPGGWRYTHRVYLEQDSKDCTSAMTYCDRWSLVLGDGSSHLLRLQATNDAFNESTGSGYSQVNIRGVRNAVAGGGYYGPNLVYYTTDGSFLRVEVTTTAPNYDGTWTAYMTNGDYWRGSILGGNPKDADQTCDRNQNCTTITNHYNPSLVKTATEIVDPFGREIVITYNVDNATYPAPKVDEIRVLAHGASMNTPDPRVNPQSLTTKVQWKTVSFGRAKPASGAWPGIFYHCISLGASQLEFTCAASYSFDVVEKITLPVTTATLAYQFQYADDTAPAAERARGELREITLPNKAGETPAKINYSWTRTEIDGNASGWSPINWFDATNNPLLKKTLNYLLQTDDSSAPATLTWNYNIGDSQSTITAPEGAKTVNDYTSRTATGDWRKGIVHKTETIPRGGSAGNGAITWRCYAWNEPWLGVNATEDTRNAFVRAEYRKLTDSSTRISATLFDQDKNGNVTAKSEYGWVTNTFGSGLPGCTPSGTVVRSTSNTYWSPTSAFSAAPAKNAANVYWNTSGNQTRSSILESRVADSSVAAITQFAYDSPTSSANVTFEYHWDNPLLPGASAPAVPTTTPTLSAANATVTGRQYNGNGVMSSVTDPDGNITSFTYGAVPDCPASFTNLYPVSINTASNRTESQLRTYTYDCATGLLKSSTFSNNNGLKTSYNYDNYGRLVEQVEGANQSDGAGAKKRRTVTEYDDSERTVRVVSDRAAYNDQQIATVYHFNQLGSLFLRRDTDDTGGAVTAAGSGGIKTVTAELFESFSTTPTQTWNRYVLSSNPFRSSADSTMGWTLRSFDTEGRVQAVKFYRGAAKPTPATAETPAAGFTGKVQYSYSGDTTTVTDPAAATRTTVIDSLGRLLSASDAGLSSASYVYDAVDNLKSVNQSGQVRDFFYTSLGRLRQATNPESGTTSYEYYPGGALKKRTDARSATVDYAVDGLNRVTKKTYTGGAYPLPEATYCYDGKAYDAGSGNCVAASRTDYVRGALTAYGSRKTAPGNLLLPVSGGNPLQTTAVASTAVNAIDALGSPGSSTHQVAGFPVAQTVSYTYNVGGALTQLQYPSGKVVQYDVNGTNRVSAVRRGAGSTDYYATGVTYAATGAMAAATMGQKPTGPAAFTQSWSYNSRLQPRQMSAVNAASQSLLSLRVAYAPTYDASTFEETAASNNGNPRVEQVDYFSAPSTTKSITRKFDYDGANRIKKLDDGGNIQNLDYDVYGNVWQVGASTGIPELKQNGSSWYVATTNQLTSVQFDAAGNQEALTVTGPSALQMRYDAEGRMVRVENTSGAGSVLAEYDFDANGKRVVRKAGNAVIQYLYGLGGQLLSEYGGAVSGGGTKYLVGDHLGSTRMVVDDAGGCVSRMDYAPFGAEIVRNTATWPCYVSVAEVSQKFTGKERDAETGLDYFGARYMSAAQGRFTSSDAPFADQHPADPQSWNLYAYGRNNPLKFTDPTGQAIQLTGTTDEDREKELAAIRAGLVNSKVSSSLYVNAELGKDGNQTGRFFVGIQGDTAAFAKAGGLEAGLAEVIGAKSIVQFGFGTEVTQKQTFWEALSGPGTQDVGRDFGGAVTLRSDATLSGHIQTVVDPTDIRGRLSEAPKPTLGETVAHELIGHARAFVRNPMLGGPRTNRMAVDAENAARARGGAARGQRTTHFGGFPR